MEPPSIGAEEVRDAEDSAPLAVERVGMRLRRWFGRPRETEEPPTPLEPLCEPEPASSWSAPEADPGREVLESTPPAPSPEPEVERTFELRAAEPVGRAESPREVPILIDLEPEDLEFGVVLKLRISVRRIGDQVSEDHSEPPMARAA